MRGRNKNPVEAQFASTCTSQNAAKRLDMLKNVHLHEASIIHVHLMDKWSDVSAT